MTSYIRPSSRSIREAKQKGDQEVGIGGEDEDEDCMDAWRRRRCRKSMGGGEAAATWRLGNGKSSAESARRTMSSLIGRPDDI